MHGYDPETAAVTPTTELLLSHKHPDDRAHVAHTIRTTGLAFSSRHRIIDTHGHTRSVVVVGDRVLDEHDEIIGSSGFYIDITDTIDKTVADLAASRGAIEQAKGMLMLIYRIPADRAFDVLVWHSQQTNTKLRDIAEGLLTRVATDLDIPTAVRTQFSPIVDSLTERPATGFSVRGAQGCSLQNELKTSTVDRPILYPATPQAACRTVPADKPRQTPTHSWRPCTRFTDHTVCVMN